MKKSRINKKYKDRVFRVIFRDKKELLELYNAINNSNYTNPEDLKITTIEDVLTNLLEEFALSKEAAEMYLEKYWKEP